MAATDPKHIVADYSKNTGTDGPRKHLISDHLEEWVDGCDQLGITITAQAALAPVEAYRLHKCDAPPAASSGQSQSHPEFSNEAFADAITEFIIADDQVQSTKSHLSTVY